MLATLETEVVVGDVEGEQAMGAVCAAYRVRGSDCNRSNFVLSKKEQKKGVDHGGERPL